MGRRVRNCSQHDIWRYCIGLMSSMCAACNVNAEAGCLRICMAWTCHCLCTYVCLHICMMGFDSQACGCTACEVLVSAGLHEHAAAADQACSCRSFQTAAASQTYVASTASLSSDTELSPLLDRHCFLMCHQVCIGALQVLLDYVQHFPQHFSQMCWRLELTMALEGENDAISSACCSTTTAVSFAVQSIRQGT